MEYLLCCLFGRVCSTLEIPLPVLHLEDDPIRSLWVVEIIKVDLRILVLFWTMSQQENSPTTAYTHFLHVNPPSLRRILAAVSTMV